MFKGSKEGVLATEIYTLTVRGEKELHGSATSLAPAELAVLVHIDGKATVAEIEARNRSLTGNALIETFQKLHSHNLIKLATESDALAFGEFFDTKPAPPSLVAITEATAEAPEGVSLLQKEGYYVRIARRAASARQLSKGEALSIVVIEDEPHLVKFLRQFLSLEGFKTRIASNRAEIIVELSRMPRPDLVLLDVMLPDADGFDVLLKMRQHPALKSVPVVMLTAKATRAAVLKGLTGGADGYITKPFEVDVLVKAVRTVLGLAPDGDAAPEVWKRP